jgi:polyphosphate kinase
MYRNLNTRVECAAPIEQRAHRERLWQIMQLHLTDRRQRWLMKSDGSYELSDSAVVPTGPVGNDPAFIGTHQRLMQDALEARARADALRLGSA